MHKSRQAIIALALLGACTPALGFLGSSLPMLSKINPFATASGCKKTSNPNTNIVMKLGKRSTAKDVVEHFGGPGILKGKTAVVTGGNSGIGLEACKALAWAGAKVVMCSRSVDAAEKAISTEIKESGMGGYVVPDANIKVVQLDLNDLEAVEAAAKEIAQEERIDFLINNAGVMCGPLSYTKQGFERQIGVNHFGHFHLTHLLLPKMKKQDFPSRIINVASTAHTFGKIDVNDLHYKHGRKYSEWGAYGQSKLANIYFTSELHERLQVREKTKISTASLHPGVISTPLWRQFNLLKVFLPFFTDKTVPQGTSTTLYACLEPSIESSNGGAYLDNCAVKMPNSNARDVRWRGSLWEETEKQIAKVIKVKQPTA